MAQPVWVTAAGDLGTIAENLFFQLSIVATDPDGGTPTYSLIAGRLPEGVQILTNGLSSSFFIFTLFLFLFFPIINID